MRSLQTPSTPYGVYYELTVIPHHKLIAAKDVVHETDAEHLVERGVDPGASLGKELQRAGVLVGALRVGPYSRCGWVSVADSVSFRGLVRW